MNKYRVIIYNDTPNANPFKTTFEYVAEDKEAARRKGNDVAILIHPETDKIAVAVEFVKVM